MKSIALRFSDSFAPNAGTILEHRKLIEKIGYAWYGKLGSPVSDKVCQDVLSSTSPRILLIHSGKADRYWAYIDRISKDVPPLEEIPAYYRDQAQAFRTWFRITKIVEADRNVMSSCTVSSSKASLSLSSRQSMSPYFIIETSDAD